MGDRDAYEAMGTTWSSHLSTWRNLRCLRNCSNVGLWKKNRNNNYMYIRVEGTGTTFSSMKEQSHKGRWDTSKTNKKPLHTENRYIHLAELFNSQQELLRDEMISNTKSHPASKYADVAGASVLPPSEVPGGRKISTKENTKLRLVPWIRWQTEKSCLGEKANK